MQKRILSSSKLAQRGIYVHVVKLGAEIFLVPRMTVGEYFSKTHLTSRVPNDEQMDAYRRFKKWYIHDLLIVKESWDMPGYREANLAYAYLSQIERQPLNHLPVLAELYGHIVGNREKPLTEVPRSNNAPKKNKKRPGAQSKTYRPGRIHPFFPHVD